jgi:hypothetical protein
MYFLLFFIGEDDDGVDFCSCSSCSSTSHPK